jgi:hypothetical protein
MCHAMGVERVDHLVGLEVVVETLGGREVDDAGVEVADLVDVGAKLRGEVLVMGRARAARLVRVQLEAPPLDLDVLGAIEVRKGTLEPTLPDVAPGADDIGPDLDLHA